MLIKDIDGCMEIKLEVDLNITVIDKYNNRARMLTNDTKVTG